MKSGAVDTSLTAVLSKQKLITVTPRISVEQNTPPETQSKGLLPYLHDQAATNYNAYGFNLQGLAVLSEVEFQSEIAAKQNISGTPEGKSLSLAEAGSKQQTIVPTADKTSPKEAAALNSLEAGIVKDIRLLTNTSQLKSNSLDSLSKLINQYLTKMGNSKEAEKSLGNIINQTLGNNGHFAAAASTTASKAGSQAMNSVLQKTLTTIVRLAESNSLSSKTLLYALDGRLQIDAGSTLKIDDDSTFVIEAGSTLSLVHGKLTVDGESALKLTKGSSMEIADSTVSIKSGGKLTLQDSTLQVVENSSINDNGGVIKLTEQSDITVGQEGKINNADGTIKLDAESHIQISQGTVNNANGNLQLTAASGIAVNDQAVLNNQGGALELKAGSAIQAADSSIINNSHGTMAMQDAANLYVVENGQLMNHKGTVGLQDGSINISGNAQLDNTGGTTELTESTLNIGQEGRINSAQGSIKLDAGATFTVMDEGLVNNEQGEINLASSSGLIVKGESLLTNSGGTIEVLDSSNIYAQNNAVIDNTEGSMNLDNTSALTVENNAKLIGAKESIQLADGAGITLADDSKLTNDSGSIVLAEQAVLNLTGTGTLDNASGEMELQERGNITVSDQGNLVNTEGVVDLGPQSSLTVKAAGTLINQQGYVGAYDYSRIEINGGQVDNSAGEINLDTQSSIMLTEQGQLYNVEGFIDLATQSSINIAGKGLLANDEGYLEGYDNSSIQIADQASVDNNFAYTSLSGASSLQVSEEGEIVNEDGGLYLDASSYLIIAGRGTLDNSAGDTSLTNSSSMMISGLVENKQGELDLESGSTLNISEDGVFRNDKGETTLASYSGLTIDTGGTMDISEGMFNNASGNFYVGNATLNAVDGNISTSGGYTGIDGQALVDFSHGGYFSNINSSVNVYGATINAASGEFSNIDNYTYIGAGSGLDVSAGGKLVSTNGSLEMTDGALLASGGTVLNTDGTVIIEDDSSLNVSGGGYFTNDNGQVYMEQQSTIKAVNGRISNWFSKTDSASDGYNPYDNPQYSDGGNGRITITNSLLDISDSSLTNSNSTLTISNSALYLNQGALTNTRSDVSLAASTIRLAEAGYLINTVATVKISGKTVENSNAIDGYFLQDGAVYSPYDTLKFVEPPVGLHGVTPGTMYSVNNANDHSLGSISEIIFTKFQWCFLPTGITCINVPKYTYLNYETSDQGIKDLPPCLSDSDMKGGFYSDYYSMSAVQQDANNPYVKWIKWKSKDFEGDDSFINYVPYVHTGLGWVLSGITCGNTNLESDMPSGVVPVYYQDLSGEQYQYPVLGGNNGISEHDNDCLDAILRISGSDDYSLLGVYVNGKGDASLQLGAEDYSSGITGYLSQVSGLRITKEENGTYVSATTNSGQGFLNQLAHYSARVLIYSTNNWPAERYNVQVEWPQWSIDEDPSWIFRKGVAQGQYSTLVKDCTGVAAMYQDFGAKNGNLNQLITDTLLQLPADSSQLGDDNGAAKTVLDDLYARWQSSHEFYEAGDMTESGKATGKLLGDIVELYGMGLISGSAASRLESYGIDKGEVRNVLQEQYGTIPDYSQQTQKWSDNLALDPSSDQTNEEGYTDYERFLKGAWEGFTGTPSRYWDDIKQLPGGIAQLMQDPPKTLSLVGDILGELAKDTLLGGPAYALLKPIMEDIYSRSQNIYSLYQQGDMENSGRETGKLVADIIMNAASLAVGGEVLSSAAGRVAGVLERAGINLEEVAGLLKSERGSWVIEGSGNPILRGLGSKTEKYIEKRGWSWDSMQEVANNPYTTREAVNKATGNAATAYYNKAGDYVVVDNITGELVQISKFGDTGWIPDSTIINPYKP